MPESIARVVVKNTIYNTMATVVGRAVGIVLTIVLARLLLPELFGIYALALSVGYILNTFVDSGANATMVRYVADALGKRKKTLAAGYFQYLLKLKMVLAAFFSIATFFLADSIAIVVFGKPALIAPLQLIALYVFVNAFFGFFSSVFYATQKVKYTTVGTIAYEITRLIAAPALVLLGYAVLGAIAGVIAATALATAVFLYFLFGKHAYLFGRPAAIETRRLLSFLFFLTVTGISGIFFFYIDSIMIGAMMPIEAVGYYRAAFALVSGVYGLLAVASVLFPVFTQLEGQRLERAFQKVFRYSAILMFPAALGLAYVAHPFIKIIYGPEYLPAVAPLALLSFLIIEGTLSPLYSTLFSAKEQPQWPTYLLLIATAMNIVLNYFMILAWGIVGAALATAVSRYFNFVALGFLAKAKLAIVPLAASIIKPLAAAMVMLAALLFLPPVHELLMGVGYILLAAAVYFAVLWVIRGFDREDITYAAGLFRA